MTLARGRWWAWCRPATAAPSPVSPASTTGQANHATHLNYSCSGLDLVLHMVTDRGVLVGAGFFFLGKVRIRLFPHPSKIGLFLQ